MEDAVDVAVRLLRHRDYPEAELRRRLEARGLAPAACDDAIERLARTGVVDDGRYAFLRAASLAGRGAGDALIRTDLEGAGISSETVVDAIAALEPELERAREIVRRRGASARTLRYLRAKGFDGDSVHAFVADASADELG